MASAGAELKDLWICIGNLDFLCSLVPGLILKLSVNVHVDMGNEGFGFTLVFYDQEAILEVICKGQLLCG